MQEITTALSLADKLSSITTTAAVILILIGNYFEVWVWGWQHRRTKVQLEKALGLLAKGQSLVEKVILPERED